MAFMPPPRGLRVLLLRDRLILHDISFAFRSHPYDRNSLIDAANLIHHRQQSSTQTNNLIDFDIPTHPGHTSNSSPQQQNRYLVLPFAPEHTPYSPPTPYQASSPEQAGITKSTDFEAVPVDAASAFLGLLPLHSAVFAVLATQVRRAGTHPNGPVLSISKVRLVRLGEAWQSKEDKDTASAVTKLLESGSLYYSIDTDLTLAAQRRGQEDKNHTFCWNFSLSHRLPQHLRRWTIRAVYGFVGTHIMRFQSDSVPSGMAEFSITVISRRSRLRAGTRYITRGVDAFGNVANSVETEQIVWREELKHLSTSFIVIRGSVPVYWRQNNGIAKPSPELDDGLIASRRAFARHFDALKDRYGNVSAVSLVDQQGSESVLANAFARHFELYLKPFDRQLPPKLVAFDFHSHCSGKEYERGLARLLDHIRGDISTWGFYLSNQESPESTSLQTGVFRVNCVDCLDRTNVVQSLVARVALSMQLEEVFRKELSSAPSKYGLRLYTESEDRYKHLWGDNADAVSKQYSGTGALKTDFTRTGKRSTTGVIGDGMKSVMRMYYKNFVDEGRQEVIDVLCGNVSIRRPAPTKEEFATSGQLNNGKDILQLNQLSSLTKSASKSNSLWYSFEALRINAGGDKQQVFIELHDDVMNVVTPDGVALEFPRNTLVSWSKRDDGKPSDRKVTPAKLRLIYKPFHLSPATASPLDLQFKGGTTARENFLRALISWSHPETASLLVRKPVRIRVISLLSAGEHHMADWGLAPEPDAKDVDEIIALMLPAGNEAARSWGLAAVPVDVDFSDYVLVGACAASAQGPSIAVLSSKRIVPTVMMVSETTTQRTSSGYGGGAAAVALQACGTSFCFVSAKTNGLTDLQTALASLKLGRQSFDVTNQFHHFTVAGLLGDVRWQKCEEAGKRWIKLPDNSSCCTLESGLSVMRNSFPTLAYSDRLKMASRWEATTQSTAKGKPLACTVLEDGVVEGRPGPQLPKNIVKSVVSVSNLRAEDVMMPRGVEQTSQMNCAVVLYCDLATVDGVTTRPSQRPSSYPEWKEALNLFMMPSDLSEIYDSFILGQILVPTPLGDPIPAGSFVLPISFAHENNGDFELPCRLAGKQTARLYGSIEVRDGDWEVREGISNLSVQRTELRPGSSITSGRNSLPPIPTHSTREDGGNVQSEKLKRRPHSTASPSAEDLQTQARRKGAMEEMNGKLNAARRKGSKQMKSVVTKLSSLLNQPSSSSTTPPLGASGTLQYPDVERRDELSSADIEKGSNYYKPRHQGDLSATNATQLHSSSMTKRVAGQIANGSFHSSGSKNGGADSFGKKDEVASFGSFQSAPSDRNYPKTKGNTSQKIDPLLEALQGEQKLQPDATIETVKPRRQFNQGGLDALLSGLAQEKDMSRSIAEGDSQDEADEWGDFESAATPAPGGPPKVSDRRSSRSDPSLIDF